MISVAPDSNETIVVTGGCGFIGSAIVRRLMVSTKLRVVNVDKLSYAGDHEALDLFLDNDRYVFIQGDICDQQLLTSTFDQYRPIGLINLAAETHVDRSIDDPKPFFKSNTEGVFNLLEVSRKFLQKNHLFRFHQVSTDEVFGSLNPSDRGFDELTRYDPSSPYSATKACADHLVRAWYRTFDLDVVITNCSNNYGPYQFPEKLIPLMILSAISGKPLPVYGDGLQAREWLHVDDHAEAVLEVFFRGKSGDSYNIGSGAERLNIDLVNAICDELQRVAPQLCKCGNYKELITFVADRPGHDRRYAIDFSKIKTELDWYPKYSLHRGLQDTVKWYLANQAWCARVSRNYSQQRLGKRE